MISLNNVPENKKLLWYFDPDLCHDLIWVYNIGYILIERAVIANYPWAEQFSKRVYDDLLPNSYALNNTDPNTQEWLEWYEPPNNLIVEDSITLPDDPEHKICLSWVHYVGLISHECRYGSEAKLYKRHHRLLSCNGQTVKLKISCCPYSLVISGEHQIDSQIRSDALYNNYSEFEWDSKIFTLFRRTLTNVSPPNAASIEDFSVWRTGSSTIVNPINVRGTGEVSDIVFTPLTQVANQPHGLLIYARDRKSVV